MTSEAAPYRVLARKYRPQSFDDLIGQEPMVRTIANAFEAGRIPQAWMLTGVRGVGKTTTARILARALNYAVPGTVDAPTVVMPELGEHCAAIIESRHVDVIEMDAASHTGINDIREIIDGVKYRPISARYKVYIIDEVHMLSGAAFNGLLKTLEEPPDHVKFVFATTEIRKVPVTVLSRCQRFDLRRIEAGRLVAHLAAICTAEGVAAEPEALRIVARAAEGSVRDSLSLLDQAIAHGGGRVEAEAVREMMGLADGARVIDLFEAVMRGDAASALKELDGQYAAGADPSAVLADLAGFVHLVTRMKLVPEAAEDASLTEVEKSRGAGFAAGLALGHLARAWQILTKGIPEVQSSPRPLAAAEMVMIRLAYAADLPSPEAAIRLLRGGAGLPASGGAAGSASASGGGGASPGAPATGRAPAAPADTGARTPLSTPPTASASHPPALQARASEPAAPAPVARALSGGFAGGTPERAEPVRAPARQAEPAGPVPTSLAEVARLAAEKRDIKLKFAVERQLRPIRFEPGLIEVEPTPDAPPSLAGDLGRRLGEWTGMRWIVTVGRGGGGETLHEAATAEASRRRDAAATDPLVFAVIAQFPGAEIVDVRLVLAEETPPPGDDFDPDAYDAGDYARFDGDDVL